MALDGRSDRGPLCIALVGPFQGGKTTLLDAVLARMGGQTHRGSETRAVGTEAAATAVTFLGEEITFIDCPGSIEFLAETRAVLPACDAAVVVCEADERKLPALEIVLRELEEAAVPRFLFLNKIDAATRRVQDTLAMLQRASRTPLLLRQIPIWKEGIAVGFIDLALERAFIYREHAASEVVDLPEGELPREREARFAMLERLADYDDALMENLITEIEPPRDQVFDDLARELREQHVVPVLIGSAARGHGVLRLLKALRHEAPGLAATRARLGVAETGPALAQVMKTVHTAHGGKLSLARVLRGRFAEGEAVTGSRGGEARIAGLFAVGSGGGQGGHSQAQAARLPEATAGQALFFARLDPVATGDAFAAGSLRPEALTTAAAPEPVYAVALRVKDRKDDVRLSSALAKIAEEDLGLSVEARPEMGELRLRGQGEMHLRHAVERLASRYGVGVETGRPGIGYRETIGQRAGARGRHKKQSGGHGQFGDVMIEVGPLPRGEGFAFAQTITGGVVPKQYIASVEAGVRDAIRRGPLGFPVCDLQVTLTDGSYHSVDSSDAAFQAAARLALAEALPKARPVLLEPVLRVEIAVPSEALARASALVSGRRGQILGYDARPGWRGWEVLEAYVPEAEIGDLIVELRSATSGVGTFQARFDHMAELSGRAADQVLADRGAAAQRAAG